MRTLTLATVYNVQRTPKPMNADNNHTTKSSGDDHRLGSICKMPNMTATITVNARMLRNVN